MTYTPEQLRQTRHELLRMKRWFLKTHHPREFISILDMAMAMLADAAKESVKDSAKENAA